MFAPHLRARHKEAFVFFLDDIARLKGPDKARPACPGLELVKRAKERLASDDVDVDTLSLVIPIRILEGRLGAAFLGDRILLRRQAPLQGHSVRFRVSLLCFYHFTAFFAIFPLKIDPGLSRIDITGIRMTAFDNNPDGNPLPHRTW